MNGLLLACIALCAAPPAQETLHWPLDLPREVTSSFGEYRPGRFHAGIDLRTGGIGQPVRAAGDGYVSRVRCSPYGYGKAVYLTLDDGYTVVYGHLDDYRDDLRAFVRAAQHAARDYTVDLSPEAGKFRVKRGEVIAKSGQTGIGVPHLHWEIRDPAGRLVNPCLLGTTWPDTTHPQIKQVLLWPEDGTVNGDITPQVLAAKPAGEGKYTTAPATVTGTLAFGIEAVDPEQGGAKLGICEATLELDGEAHFRVRNDYLDYETNDAGALSFCMPMAERGQFLTLWRWPGNNAPSYAISKRDGRADAPKTKTEATLRVADFHGNAAVVTVPLLPGETASAAPGAPGTGQGSIVVEAWDDCLTLSFRFDAAEGELPTAEVEFSGTTTPLAMVRAGQRTYRAALRPTAPGVYTLRASHPRAGTIARRYCVYQAGQPTAAFSEAGATVLATPQSTYGTLFVGIAEEASPPPDPIRRLGRAWSIGPMGQPMREAVTVSLPAPEGAAAPGRVAIYRSTGGGWSALGTTREAGRLNAKTTRLGTFAALEDTQPPIISKVTPGQDGPAASRRPAIEARISDVGSGIASYSVHCGQQWLLTEFDPEQGIIRWEQDEDLPTGSQGITIRVADAAGNETTLVRAVSIP